MLFRVPPPSDIGYLQTEFHPKVFFWGKKRVLPLETTHHLEHTFPAYLTMMLGGPFIAFELF